MNAPRPPSRAPKALNPKTARPKHLTEAAQAALLRTSSLLDEVARNYVARLRRELTDLSLLLEEHQRLGLKPQQIEELRAGMELLQQVVVDPARGRRRDLKKIDEIIGKLQSMVEKW